MEKLLIAYLIQVQISFLVQSQNPTDAAKIIDEINGVEVAICTLSAVYDEPCDQ
jgi:hypothetical protein